MATETYELDIDGVDVASYRSTTLHFSGVGVASGDTLAAGESLIAGFIASLETIFLSGLPTSYNLMKYRARRATPKPSAVAHTSYEVGDRTGSRPLETVAEQTCPVIFLVPTMGTKSGGKIFWPCMAKADLVNNVPGAAWKTAVNSFITAAKAGFSSGGITWTLGIFSRKHRTTSTVALWNYSPVLGFQSKRRKPVGASG